MILSVEQIIFYGDFQLANAFIKFECLPLLIPLDGVCNTCDLQVEKRILTTIKSYDKSNHQIMY